MDHQRPYQRSEDPSHVPGRPYRRVDGGGGTVRAGDLERPVEPANAALGELSSQIVQRGTGSLRPLERWISVDLQRPVSQPLAGLGIYDPGADQPGCPPGASAE